MNSCFTSFEPPVVWRLERIDEIKRLPDDSSMREFNYLWGKLREFLVEEREDVNARSIEQSLRTSRKVDRPDRPKVKTPAVPAKASPAKSSVSAAVSSPHPKDPPKGPPKGAKGTSKGKGKPVTAEEKAKTPCIFHQMPMGVLMGTNANIVMPSLLLRSQRIQKLTQRPSQKQRLPKSQQQLRLSLHSAQWSHCLRPLEL